MGHDHSNMSPVKTELGPGAQEEGVRQGFVVHTVFTEDWESLTKKQSNLMTTGEAGKQAEILSGKKNPGPGNNPGAGGIR